MRYAARELFGLDNIDVATEQGVTIRTIRNADFREVTLEASIQQLAYIYPNQCSRIPLENHYYDLPLFMDLEIYKT
jgi:hypothetical protein